MNMKTLKRKGQDRGGSGNNNSSKIEMKIT